MQPFASVGGCYRPQSGGGGGMGGSGASAVVFKMDSLKGNALNKQKVLSDGGRRRRRIAR